MDRMLVWTSTTDGKAEDLVYSVDRAGTRSAIVGRATSDDVRESIAHIAWSPAGTQMAGLWLSANSARLETRNADGTAPKALRTFKGE